MRDPTDLHQQDRDAEADEAAAEFKRKQATEDFKWLMAHRQGRRLMWGWLADAGVTRTPFSHSGSQTAFNCGVQQAGLRLLAQIHEHVPDAYVMMLKEHKE